MDTRLRVASCDTDERLAAAAGLFNHYRHHYGESDGDARAREWLSEMVRTRRLTVWAAWPDTEPDTAPVGLATSHEMPASLVLGTFWQVRDLYVIPGARRRGVAAALVGAVRDAALVAGATRLSLVTEPDNAAALSLYRGLGFRPVEGVSPLSLDLAPLA